MYYTLAPILQVLFYIAIICAPVGIVTKENKILFGSVVGVVVIWSIYLAVSCNTNTTRYIGNLVDVAQVFQTIEAAIAVPPQCVMGIQNYHHEMRTEHYRDKDGNRQTR